MRKRKKGSTFVIVVVVMAIIFTTGTAVLALTVNNYKIGINKSKRLENLYKADSGLDTVENIIIKTSQEAIKYADNEIKNKIIASSTYISKDEINEKFKEEFYKFINLNVKDININGNAATEDKSILEYLILNNKLIETVSKDINSKFIFRFKDLTVQAISYKLEIPTDGYEENKDNNGDIENITLIVNSAFESTEGEFKNERKVSKTYTITAPEYSSDVKIIDIYPVFDEKAIAADGNMNLEDSTINIEGNIWIKGEDNSLNSNSSFTYDKYKNGIKLSNSNFTINGDIYSNNTLNLIKNNEVIVDGNIYSRNIYVGKENYGEVSSNNTLNLNKDVIVNNDLAINTANSNISIKENFYGINDKTTDTTTAEKALQSSSIIINEATKTTLNLNNAYILGVAYLNATDESGKKYQTGESIAVKENYLAYTDVDKDLVGNVITLKYYSPLQLLESIEGETKADYISEYYTTNSNSLNYGGVKIEGEVRAIGASIDKDGKIQNTTIKIEDAISEVKGQREDYARNVFAMGDNTGLEGLSKLYENQVVKRKVVNQIDLEKLKYIEGKTFNEINGILVVSHGNLEINNKRIANKTIEKGLIIVNGSIDIIGEFNFTGTIIATGDINFQGVENKNITYDARVVRNVIADNYDLLKDIFNTSSSKGKEVKISSSNEIYNSDNFLETSLWKIER